jgi:hypothetical protein
VCQIARTFSTLLITACCLLSPPKDQAKCSIAYSSTRLSSGHWLNWSVNIMSCCLPSSETGCVSKTSRTYLMICTCKGCFAASHHACLPALLGAFLPSADPAELSLIPSSSACRRHSSRRPWILTENATRGGMPLDRQCSPPGSIMKLRCILASYSGTHQHEVAKAASWRGCHTSGARLPLTNLLPQLLR